MAEYMDLSERGSIKVTIGLILAWMIFCAVLLVGVGIRELKAAIVPCLSDLLKTNFIPHFHTST